MWVPPSTPCLARHRVRPRNPRWAPRRGESGAALRDARHAPPSPANRQWGDGGAPTEPLADRGGAGLVPVPAICRLCWTASRKRPRVPEMPRLLCLDGCHRCSALFFFKINCFPIPESDCSLRYRWQNRLSVPRRGSVCGGVGPGVAGGALGHCWNVASHSQLVTFPHGKRELAGPGSDGSGGGWSGVG